MIASATWSTWIGGISKALATDSNGEPASKAPESPSDPDVDFDVVGFESSIPIPSDAAVLFAPEGRACWPSLTPWGNKEPSDRRTPDGVGRVVGTLAWSVAERSNRTAAGVVRGR
jgi:hypothetical protein